MIDLLSNTKVFGNPAKIFMNLQEVLLNVFKENKGSGSHHNTRKVFRESFLTLFQAHSKATGNFEHAMFNNYMDEAGSNNR